MGKRMLIAIIALCVAVGAGLTAAGIMRANNNTQNFMANGYVLQGDDGALKRIGFEAQASYLVSRSGFVTFLDTEGIKSTVSRESFVHLEDNVIMALGDGILLDLNDLSDNFINNYYITAGLPITASGGSYRAETSSGTVEFGENIWKLTDNKYMVRSETLSVHFSDEDIREVKDYVQVSVAEDGIVRLLTEENLWTTLSDECYIETADGVRIYPVAQLVDNGTYKLSVAKLSVDPDDAIVLTEAETRRQIVPELNIETIDGEDGADGEAGENGQTGEDGIEGEAGEAGEDGEDGEDGENGEHGESGERGENGELGAQGSSGASGQRGSDGEQGQTGTTGTSGGTGRTGGIGKDGSNGGIGARGNDAQVQGSTNTALPVLTFASFEPTATNLTGRISVDSGSDLIVAGGDDSEKYPATVKIYNEETGEATICYLNDTNYNPDDNNTWVSNFASSFSDPDDEGIPFTAGNALTADTNYRISVSAYYQLNDTIYSREFISRNFYTDSAGVLLSANPATVGSVSLQVARSDNSVTDAKVVLLTPEQNAAFEKDYATLLNNNGYTYRWDLSYTGDNPSASNATISTGVDYADVSLPPNTEYIARAVVTSGGLTKLTNQKLQLSTLKRAPIYVDTESTKAYFNRSTGAFEVYRIGVTDPDHGAVEYIYNVYRKDGTVPLDSQTISAENAGSTTYLSNGTTFYLDNGEYEFETQMRFFDNEKSVLYTLGRRSELVRAIGGTLPKLSLLPKNSNYPESSKYEGTLVITIDSNSSMTIDADNPLELRLYAEGVTFLYDNDSSDGKDGIISIKGSDAISMSQGSTLLYSVALTSNNSTEKRVTLDLEKLYKNTTYILEVSGTVDLNNGNGPQKGRSLGSVTFRTRDTVGFGASWNIYNSTSTSEPGLQVKLVPDSNESSDRIAYALQELAEGQVQLSLAQGSGTNKQVVKTKTITKANGLNDLLSQNPDSYGLTINTNSLFDGYTLSSSTTYSVEIGQVTDMTATLNMGYVNNYIITEPSRAVTTGDQPPDLSIFPATQVKVTEITNATAGSYGGTKNNALPDDAIVGYLLEAQYNNSDRLGKTVTYYAFEYDNFYNTFITARQDIVKAAMNDESEGRNLYTVIQPITMNINKNSDTVPGLVLLFGGDKCEQKGSTAKYEIWTTGEATVGDHLIGMGRGYRYLFAYTATYSISQDGTTAPNSYPYDHGDYNQYRDRYGAGYVSERVTALGAKQVGSSWPGVAYILNSGMQSAPRIAPEFHSYVYETATHAWPNSSIYAGTGTLTVHYTYRDIDHVLTDSTRITGFGTDSGSQTLTQDVLTPDSSGRTWYKMTIPYSATASVEYNVASPQVEYSNYDSNFAARYNELLKNHLYLPEQADSVAYLCTVAYELPYGDRYQSSDYNERVYIVKSDQLASNYIDFRLTDRTDGGNADLALGQRSYAMKLTFKAEGVSDLEVWLPVTGSASSGYSSRLPTSKLTDFVGKSYTVTASLYYDNGLQGWAYLDPAVNSGGMFALQYINTEGGQESSFGLDGGYVVSSNSGSNGSTPQAAIVTQTSSVTAQTLRSSIVAGESTSRTDDSAVDLVMHGLTGWTSTKSVYADDRGVLSGSASSSVANLGERYVTPKGVSEYKLKFWSDGNMVDKKTDTLDYITPSISMRDSDREQSQDAIEIRNFVVDGARAGDKVYAMLYTTASLSSASFLEATNRVSTTPLEFVLSEDGNGNLTPTASKTFSYAAGTTTQLSQNTNYYLVFYMNLNNQNTVLMKSGTSNLAVYTVKTSSYVTFDKKLGPTFANSSYFDKTVTLDFFMDRVLNVSVTADILDVNNNIILSYNDMKNAVDPEAPEWKMLQITNPLQKKDDRNANIFNTVRIDLKPSTLRESIIPGHTYKIKLTAWEGGVDVTDPDCTSEFEWNVPPVTNLGAVIYVTDVGSDSITYEVSVSDDQRSLMGSAGYANGSGLYAVRFTDSAGNWIPTQYDGQIYPVAPKQEFILSSATIVGDQNAQGYIAVGATTPGDRMYRLNVYAVADLTHNGLSKKTGPSDATGKTWKYFFEGTTAELNGRKFKTSLLDTFWKTDTLYNNPADANHNAHYGYDVNSDMSDYEADFCIAQKQQELADPSNIYVVDAEYYVITKSGNTFTLNMPGSYGLDKAIKKVEWQVTGMTSGGQKSGSEADAEGNLFTSYGSGDSRGCQYTFEVADLPSDIAYNVVIQIYTATDATAPHSSYSGARIS